ncbi:hypothetical protein [Pedobacter panaciterrae]|uniref:Uncharacterized protein n=1 Tax=Pedobacter panaciterrae TaxID=363849 RepID=A0ABU8NLA5_9SPHI
MNNQNGNEEQVPKEIGSNLTGTAIHAKPGHLRDIPIDRYIEELENKDLTAPKKKKIHWNSTRLKKENKSIQNKGSEN